MLTALTSGGKQVVLTRQSSLTSLREWRKNETYYCPQCKEQVLLKVGEIVIPHFAHLKQTTCRDSFSEGESPTHLLGKIQLYELFSQLHLQTKMEPYLPAIRQRPDLLVTWQNEQIPIEFQCSTIPIARILERNAGYHTVNMLPIWIVLTPPKVQDTSAVVLTYQLTQFQQHFIRHIHSSTKEKLSVFLTYNPSKQQFHYLSHFIHLRGTAFAMCHSVMRIKHQTIPFAIPATPSTKDIEELTRQYQSALRKYLRSVIGYNQRGIHHRFLRACYEMRVQPILLPAWIGVPTFGQAAFTESDCEWQLLLIAAIRQTRKTPFQLDHSILHSFIKTFEGDSMQQLEACQNYVDFLREQRIDIYRMDKFMRRDFVLEILSGRFLAMHARN
ncbi:MULTISPECIES: competence protein CoiA [unclassified Sporosarcina]|uniref:competence protein CoiA n=1 Tax=unclassified Sporosarcina TaxID=2647733 RepID=UPI0013041B7E|nr:MULTISPECIES: competence protein CoiA family protein [unclassified Sporosarcina]